MQHEQQVSRAGRPTKVAVGASLAVAAGLTASAAIAASNIVTDTDNVHLRVVRSQFDDGFVGDWHTHPGPVIVQVQTGRFKIYQGTCNPTVVGPGETFIEAPNVPVKGVAEGPIAWTTTFVYESGLAPSTPATDPCA